MKSLETQVGGSHYKDYPIQPVEFIYKNELGFIEGCIIKYICRYKEKEFNKRIEDLQKIKQYADILIEFEANFEKNKEREKFRRCECENMITKRGALNRIDKIEQELKDLKYPSNSEKEKSCCDCIDGKFFLSQNKIRHGIDCCCICHKDV